MMKNIVVNALFAKLKKISQEEKELRKQFDLSHQDITYRDF